MTGQVFFIVGVGRSGTSLLQSILASHSKIEIPPETGFVRNAILSFKKLRKFTIADLTNSNERISRIKPYFSNASNCTFKDEVEFYESLKTNMSKGHEFIFGDKDPRLIEYIYGVNKLFPEGKFINLVRDPRDILVSKKKAQWSKNKPSLYHIFANYVQLRIGEKAGLKLPGRQYYVLCYEDLLKEPENEIMKICDFLDINFEKSMLSFQDKAKELVSDDEKQWKKETFGPLLKHNANKWIKELKNWEIALIEEVSDQAFSVGGYKKSQTFNERTIFEKVIIKVTGIIFKLIGYMYIVMRINSQKILIKWKM